MAIIFLMWLVITINGISIWLRKASILCRIPEEKVAVHAFEIWLAGCWLALVFAPAGNILISILSLYQMVALVLVIFFALRTLQAVKLLSLRLSALSLLLIAVVSIFFVPHKTFLHTLEQWMYFSTIPTMQWIVGVLLLIVILGWIIGSEIIDKKTRVDIPTFYLYLQFSLKTLIYIQVVICVFIAIMASGPLRRTFITIVFTIPFAVFAIGLILCCFHLYSAIFAIDFFILLSPTIVLILGIQAKTNCPWAFLALSILLLLWAAFLPMPLQSIPDLPAKSAENSLEK